MADGEEEVRARLGGLGAGILQRVRERPWPTLLLAAMAGYVAGGGLFSRLTRPLARAALGALLVPGFRERIAGLAREGAPGGAM